MNWPRLTGCDDLSATLPTGCANTPVLRNERYAPGPFPCEFNEKIAGAVADSAKGIETESTFSVTRELPTTSQGI